MIEAQDFMPIEEEKNSFKMGVVVELFPNSTAKITFDGEDTASLKQYAYLNSYVPKVGDRVMLAAISSTYVVLGKINFNVTPSIENATDPNPEFTTIKTTGQATLQHLKVVGNVSFFNGAPSGKQDINNVPAITVSGTADTTYSSNEVTMLNALKTDVTNLRTSVNSIITALKQYSLV